MIRKVPRWAWLLGVLLVLLAFASTLDWDQWRRDCEDVRGGAYYCGDSRCVCLAKGTVLP